MSLSRQTTVLVVEDKRPIRELLVGCLRAAGYETERAVDGAEAWEFLERAGAAVDVVLLDRRMPRMDGMELLARMKADSHLRHIPVVMQTAADSKKEISEGIRAGVFYYLTKPIDPEILLSITAAAVEDHARFLRLAEEVKRHASVLAFMNWGRFEIRTPAEGTDLAVALAGGFPRPRARVTGLSELITNAIEHGNLKISYEEKSRLIAERRLDDEIGARLEAPGYRDKRVVVSFIRHPGAIHVTIKDEGDGFDWQRYLEMDPARVFATHGRGIALARKLSFDRVEYKGCGNEVECTVFLDSGAGGPGAGGEMAR